MKQKLYIQLIIGIFICIPIYSQSNSTISTGGDLSSSNGIINYSIGQIFTNSNYNSSNYIIEGNQQPYEILTLANLNLDINTMTFKIFPNPTSDFVTLLCSDENCSKNSFQIFDICGKEVIKKRTLSEKETKINLQQFQIGTYLLLITNQNNSLTYLKIIKN